MYRDSVQKIKTVIKAVAPWADTNMMPAEAIVSKGQKYAEFLAVMCAQLDTDAPGSQKVLYGRPFRWNRQAKKAFFDCLHAY